MYVDRALELRREEDRRFQQMVGISIGLHGVIFAFVLAWKWAFPAEPLIKLDDTIEIDLISISSGPSSTRKSNRLPDKETFVPAAQPKPEEPAVPSLKPPQPAKEQARGEEKPEEKTKPEPAREAKSIEEALKKDQPPATQDPGLDEASRQALNERIAQRMAMLNAKDRVQKLTGTPGLKDRSASSADGTGGPGGEGPGGSGGANAGADPAWGKALNERISEVWITLPTWRNKNLKADVYVKVDTEGGIRDVTVAQTSGDVSFDEAARRAVRKAAPLPLPTKTELRTAILSEGFYLGFNPKGLTQ